MCLVNIAGLHPSPRHLSSQVPPACARAGWAVGWGGTPFPLILAAAAFTQPDSWRGRGKQFADEILSSAPPVSFFIWVGCPASCCRPRPWPQSTLQTNGFPLLHLQGLRIISLFLSSSPTDASLHWHSRGVREARGSWGPEWCLWDARHLGCWETWAPSLISSRFSFHPAVWHWGLLSLIETRVCGKSRVYASADQPRVVKAARACSWRLQELASLDKWLHLDGQAEMSC